MAYDEAFQTSYELVILGTYVSFIDFVWSNAIAEEASRNGASSRLQTPTSYQK